ncbi:hypothetical protein, partial [Pseudomonas japonica]|uniref:hypothetical protein n=1 Tax=Pseudomonas japonica TaxID=256466 RepID=UPI001C3F4733
DAPRGRRSISRALEHHRHALRSPPGPDISVSCARHKPVFESSPCPGTYPVAKELNHERVAD